MLAHCPPKKVPITTCCCLFILINSLAAQQLVAKLDEIPCLANCAVISEKKEKKKEEDVS